MGDRTLDFAALGVLIFVVLTIIYGIIYIHDIPYEIAKKRNHPHQDAIHTAGWVSLFLMHTIWPFLWIWATLYKPGLGWGFADSPGGQGGRGELPEKAALVPELVKRLDELEEREKVQADAYSRQIRTLQGRIAELEKPGQLNREV